MKGLILRYQDQFDGRIYEEEFNTLKEATTKLRTLNVKHYVIFSRNSESDFLRYELSKQQTKEIHTLEVMNIETGKVRTLIGTLSELKFCLRDTDSRNINELIDNLNKESGENSYYYTLTKTAYVD